LLAQKKKIFVLEIIFNFEDCCFSDKNETCLSDIPKAILPTTNFGSATEQKN